MLENIYGAANTNSAALVSYGITAPMLTAFQAVMMITAQQYQNHDTKSVKATFTKNIGIAIKDIDLLLKDQIDKLVVTFKPTKPDFLNSYKTARIIIDPDTTTTQLKGKVIDHITKLPIKGAKIEFMTPPITLVFTNLLGNYAQKPLAAGTYKVSV